MLCRSNLEETVGHHAIGLKGILLQFMNMNFKFFMVSGE